MRRVAVLAAALAALALAATASAATATDPNEVNGKLDLRSVTAVRSGGLLRVSVRAWEPWSNGVLAPGPNRLVVLFDGDGDGSADYRGRLLRTGGVLVVLLTGQGSAFEPIPVTRVNGSTVRFTFPEDVLVAAGDPLGVAVTSKYVGTGCAAACRDRAPDAGWLVVPA